jgi:hypothetical protein
MTSYSLGSNHSPSCWDRCSTGSLTFYKKHKGKTAIVCSLVGIGIILAVHLAPGHLFSHSHPTHSILSRVSISANLVLQSPLFVRIISKIRQSWLQSRQIRQSCLELLDYIFSTNMAKKRIPDIIRMSKKESKKHHIEILTEILKISEDSLNQRVVKGSEKYFGEEAKTAFVALEKICKDYYDRALTQDILIKLGARKTQKIWVEPLLKAYLNELQSDIKSSLNVEITNTHQKLIDMVLYDFLKPTNTPPPPQDVSSVTAESPVASDDKATTPWTILAEIGKAHEAVAVATQMVKAGRVRILE